MPRRYNPDAEVYERLPQRSASRKRARDLTTMTDPKYGPWRPMRGAIGEARAVMERVAVPWRVAQPQSPLVPARGNVLTQGADMATRRRGGRWRA